MNPFANRWCVGALLPVAVSFCPTMSLARQASQATVVVHVYNNAKVPPSILAESGGYVRETLARVGVEIKWVDEMSRVHGTDTSRLENPWTEGSVAEVSIAIVTQPERIHPSLKRDESAMGWTPSGQNVRAYAFYDRVEAFVLKNAFRVSSVRVPRVLSYAIEHELGHLLIPSLARSHSDTGIMKAQLTAVDLAPVFLDAIGFSTKEGELMTREILRRAHIQARVSAR